MSRYDPEIQAVLIAGPTASGKSRLALAMARASDGVVVNADSMQVYDGLRILTARPSDEDLRAAPHRLYGHVAPAAAYSVGEWLGEAQALLAELREERRLAIFCGGTGLYFKALLGGLDEMPGVPAEVRERWRARMAQEGPERLHAELSRVDPEAAARIKPGDPQRITRALEIAEATGRPLGALQKGRGRALVDAARTLKIVLTPPRETQREAIARRFALMLEAGAIGEVRAFARLPGAMEGTAGKAIGVAELADHIAGQVSLDDAERRAVTRSRQYAKRQDTWFRHQVDARWLQVSELSDADADKLTGLVKER